MVRDLSLRGAFENVRRADSQACELTKVKVLPRNAAAALQGAQNLHLPCHDVLPVAHTLPHLRVRLQPAVVHLRLQPEHALAERPHVLRPGLEKVVNLLHGVQDVTRKVLKALACVRLGLFDDLGLVLRGHEAVLAVRRALPQLIGDGDHGVHRRLQPLVRHRPRRSRGWWDNRGSAPRLSDPPRVLAQKGSSKITGFQKQNSQRIFRETFREDFPKIRRRRPPFFLWAKQRHEVPQKTELRFALDPRTPLFRLARFTAAW